MPKTDDKANSHDLREDGDLRMLVQVVEALKPLDTDAQERVLRAAGIFLGIDWAGPEGGGDR